VVNGDFTLSTGWSVDQCVISGGVCTFSGSNWGSLQRAITGDKNTVTYYLRYDASGATGSGFWTDGGCFATTTLATTNGSKEYQLAVTDSTANLKFVKSDGLTAFTMDNVSMKMKLGANVWKATVTTEPKVVLFDGVRGNAVASLDLVDSTKDWYWAVNILYVYSTTDPDTAYTTPGIEAALRDYGIVNMQSYITIQDLTVETTNGSGGFFNWTNAGARSNIIIQRCISGYHAQTGIHVSNAHASLKTTAVLIDDDEVYECGTSGINISTGVNSVTISNCTVYHCIWGSTDYQAGIRTWGNSVDGDNIIVENNEVYAQYFSGAAWSKGNGIHIDETGPNTPPIVKYNYVHDNEEIGIFVEHFNGCQIYYNLCSGNGEEGILLFRDSEDTEIYNNTCYGNGYGIGIRGNGTANEMNGNLIKNNILSGNTTSELLANYGGENDGTNGTGNIYTYNCLGAEAANFVTWGAATPDTYDIWETAYGATTSSAEADPVFVSVVTPDFSLQPTSPCINAGTNVGLTADYAGNPIGDIIRVIVFQPIRLAIRPVRDMPDIGAYEYKDH
jgi:parallel beta-helix repeat protein